MYELFFVPRPDKNQIRLYRIEDGHFLDKIVYTENGIRPAYHALEPDSKVHWDRAFKIMGWVR